MEITKYSVTVVYKNGHKKKYTYEGNGEHNGKPETVVQRIVRHFSKPDVTLYSAVKI